MRRATHRSTVEQVGVYGDRSTSWSTNSCPEVRVVWCASSSGLLLSDWVLWRLKEGLCCCGLLACKDSGRLPCEISDLKDESHSPSRFWIPQKIKQQLHQTTLCCHCLIMWAFYCMQKVLYVQFIKFKKPPSIAAVCVPWIYLGMLVGPIIAVSHFSHRFATSYTKILCTVLYVTYLEYPTYNRMVCGCMTVILTISVANTFHSS